MSAGHAISSLKSILDIVATLIIIVAALVMVTLFLHDRATVGSGVEPIQITEWEEYNRLGIRMGREDAPFVLTEFMDFTCPFCQSHAAVSDSLLTYHGGRFAVVFHHFPLPNRELAMPSAIAAECAAEQGRFDAMYRQLLTESRIGEGTWEAKAVAAGVPDTVAFNRCVSRPHSTFSRITQGLTLGRELGVVGTPTLWLNGQVVTAGSVGQFLELSESMESAVDADRGTRRRWVFW